ncbi:MAG: hypothetical protein AAGB16_08590, partial [Pseudomonadota bacterium]
QKKTKHLKPGSEPVQRVSPTEVGETHMAVPSPAKQLQSQLHAHYQPLYKKLAVTLVSLLVAITVISGWIGPSETVVLI